MFNTDHSWIYGAYRYRFKDPLKDKKSMRRRTENVKHLRCIRLHRKRGIVALLRLSCLESLWYISEVWGTLRLVFDLLTEKLRYKILAKLYMYDDYHLSYFCTFHDGKLWYPCPNKPVLQLSFWHSQIIPISRGSWMAPCKGTQDSFGFWVPGFQ